jgi:hypothetical protein
MKLPSNQQLGARYAFLAVEIRSDRSGGWDKMCSVVD